MPSTTVTAEHYVRGRIEFADDERPKFRTLDGDTYLVASIGATWVKPVGVPARLHLRVTADRLDGGFANLDFDSGHAPVDDLLVEHLPALLEAMVPHGLPSRLAPASIWFQRPANDDNPQVRHWALARWAAEAHGLPVDCDSDVVSVVDAERRYAEGSEWWAARPLTARMWLAARLRGRT